MPLPTRPPTARPGRPQARRPAGWTSPPRPARTPPAHPIRSRSPRPRRRGRCRPPPAGLARAYALMYGGVGMHPKYWHEPLRAGTETRGAAGLPPGFVPASANDYRRFVEPKALARTLSIPSIGVESDVRELAIVNLGDSRAYETPKNTVGHIPETADPGELGNGWFFGHLESPFRGEGNVFQRLPEIPDLLRHYAEVGEGSVYVVIESDEGRFPLRGGSHPGRARRGAEALRHGRGLHHAGDLRPAPRLHPQAAGHRAPGGRRALAAAGAPSPNRRPWRPSASV